MPGFINCERWVGAENPKISIATYDLESLDVLQSDAYRAIGGENLSPWSKRVIGEGEAHLPLRSRAAAAGQRSGARRRRRAAACSR